MKIFLADDDKNLNIILSRTLEENGFAVGKGFDGEKIERHLLLNNADYDAVVLDWMLPSKSGLEICKHLREAGIALPVLMLSGKNEVDNKIAALNAGADDYLTKPFSSKELLARIRALLRRPKAMEQNHITRANIVLNTTRQQLKVNNKTIRLTLKEFGILEYLMRNTDQVIQRDVLISHVWDSEYTSLTNIIDVHIVSLRKKLKAAKGSCSIETVRGIGYKFLT